MTTCASAVQRRAYRRHRPEQTVLHAIVREHLTAFLRHADEHYARPLPRYARRAFEQYLRCGLPEHGFLRVRCDDCGHDRIVAFSCKERGTCPSCAGRTMTNTAAHLVDRVLPNVPIRQWVLSLPFDLHAHAARTPALISAIDRILFREIERWMQRSAGPSGGRAGSTTFVQRFGGSLNLHVHFHVLVLEGLFTRDGDALPVFHPALAPTRADLLDVLGRVRTAVIRWVERNLSSAPRADLPEDDVDALTACAHAATQPGLYDRLPSHDAAAAGTDDDSDEPPGIGRSSVALHGFNLHAAVRVGADDDVARERLVRYCARPSFALERLSVLPDGRIAYRLKQPRKDATHRILSPIELLARIAALIPPPRQPFLRYHGVLAPSSKWRSAIVPREGEGDTDPAACAAHGGAPRTRHIASSTTTVPPGGVRRVTGEPTRATGADDAVAKCATRAARRDPADPRPTTAPGSRPPHLLRPKPSLAGVAGADTSRRSRAPFAVLAPAHRARLACGDGDMLAKTHRLEWSKLLRRTFAADVLACPRFTAAPASSPPSKTPPKPPASSPPSASARSQPPAARPRRSTTTSPNSRRPPPAAPSRAHPPTIDPAPRRALSSEVPGPPPRHPLALVTRDARRPRSTLRPSGVNCA